jgi:hypothetical protein
LAGPMGKWVTTSTILIMEITYIYILFYGVAVSQSLRNPELYSKLCVPMVLFW